MKSVKMYMCVRSLVAFLITGVDTDGFTLEAQPPVALGTPTVEFLDYVLGPLQDITLVQQMVALSTGHLLRQANDPDTL